jgi:acetyl-CoA acyltransferase 1
LKGLIERTKVDPKLIQDIVVGNVNQPGAGAITSRMAGFLAGIPETTTLVTVNRFCSSGLEAVALVASKIKAGHIDLGIGSGVESMTMYDMQSSMNPENLAEQIFDNEKARDCLMPMGQTSENVAEKVSFSLNIPSLESTEKDKIDSPSNPIERPL